MKTLLISVQFYDGILMPLQTNFAIAFAAILPNTFLQMSRVTKEFTNNFLAHSMVLKTSIALSVQGFIIYKG